MDRIRVNSHQLTKRSGMNASVDFANGWDGLKRYDFDMYVSCLHAITSSTIIFLCHSKRRTKGVLRDSREGVGTIARASGANDLITNIGIGSTNRPNKLVNGGACKAASRTAGPRRRVFDGIERRLRRVLIVRRQFSSVLCVVERIQVFKGSDLRHLRLAVSIVITKGRQHVLRVIKERRARRFTSARRHFLLVVTRGVNRATFTTIDLNAARFLLTRLLIDRNPRRVQAHSGRITLLLRRGSGINRYQKVTNTSNAESRGDKGLKGGA